MIKLKWGEETGITVPKEANKKEICSLEKKNKQETSFSKVSWYGPTLRHRAAISHGSVDLLNYFPVQ